MVFRHHALRLIDTVVVNGLHVDMSHALDVAVIFDGQRAHLLTDGEQAARKQPFAQIVIVAKVAESLGRDTRYQVLKRLQVVRPPYLLMGARVYGNEVAEAELTTDVVAQLLRQRLALLHDKAHMHLLCHCPHAFLRTLQQERHRRVVVPYQAA